MEKEKDKQTECRIDFLGEDFQEFLKSLSEDGVPKETIT
jgi:hypothetical protein